MLRIGEFTDTFIPLVDGVGRVVQAYANTLAGKGHQVTVVTPMYDTGYRGGYPFELVDFVGSDVPLIRQYKTGEPPLDAHYRARIKMIPLDIVHAHSPFIAGSEALRLARKRSLPMVGTFHSKYKDDFKKITRSDSLAKLGTKIVVDFYKRCDEVWAVSDRTAGVLSDYGYHGKIIVMPNGVDMRSPKEDAVAEVRRRFSISDKVPMFLFVGQMNWKKNIGCILEAFSLLRSSGVPFSLILAGQGPDESEIRSSAAALSLSDSVQFAGHLTDPALLDALYSQASLFVFPSLYDNAPMVIREAAVMKTPSVMVDISSASEVIEDNVNGYLCKNDPKDLLRVIRYVIDHPDRASEAGERAYESIPVSWDDITDEVVERYSRLIHQAKNGRLSKKPRRLL